MHQLSLLSFTEVYVLSVISPISLSGKNLSIQYWSLMGDAAFPNKTTLGFNDLEVDRWAAFLWSLSAQAYTWLALA